VVWAGRTDCGQSAFAEAPLREHGIGFVDILTGVLLLFVAVPSLSLAVSGSNGNGDTDWGRQDMAHLVLMAGQLITLAILLTVGSRRFMNGWQGLGLKGHDCKGTFGKALLYFIVGFGLTFLTLTVTLLICQALGYDEVQRHEFLEALEKNPPWHSVALLLILPAIVAPLVEEVFFRGILQSFLIRFLSRRGVVNDKEADEGIAVARLTACPASCRWTGIIITAGSFALVHGDWQHWPALFVLGMVLGYSYERQGNLWMPILVHSWFNILPLLVTMAQ